MEHPETDHDTTEINGTVWREVEAETGPVYVRVSPRPATGPYIVSFAQYRDTSNAIGDCDSTATRSS